MPASHGGSGIHSQRIHERLPKAGAPVTRVWVPLSREKRLALAQARTGSSTRCAVDNQTGLLNTTGGSGITTRAFGDIYPEIIDGEDVVTAPEDTPAHSLASAGAGGEERAEKTNKSARELTTHEFGAFRSRGAMASAATSAEVPTMSDRSATEPTRSTSAERLGSVPQLGGSAATAGRASEGSGLAELSAIKNGADPAGEGTTYGVEGKDRSQPRSGVRREIWEDFEHNLNDSPASTGSGRHERQPADVKPGTERFAMVPRVFRPFGSRKSIGGIVAFSGVQSATRPSGMLAGRNALARGNGKLPKIQASASWAAKESKLELEDGPAPIAGLKQEHVLRRRALAPRRCYSNEPKAKELFDPRKRSDLSSIGIGPAWLRDPSNVEDHAQARETNQSSSAVEIVDVDPTPFNSDLFVGVSSPETKRSDDNIDSVGAVLAPCASDLSLGKSAPETNRSGDRINSVGIVLTPSNSDLSVSMGAPDTKRSGDGINSFGVVLTPYYSDLSVGTGAPDTKRSASAMSSVGAALSPCNSEHSAGMRAARHTISMQYGGFTQASGPSTAGHRSFFDEASTPANSELSIGMTRARQSHMLQDYAFACAAKGDRLDSDSAISRSSVSSVRNGAREKYESIAEEGTE